MSFILVSFFVFSMMQYFKSLLTLIVGFKKMEGELEVKEVELRRREQVSSLTTIEGKCKKCVE